MRYRSLLGGVAFWLCCAHADAQSSSDIAKAKRLFSVAKEDFTQREYEAALRGFQEAYALSKQPELLFNIAQCYRELKRYQEAIDTYRAVLRESDDPKTQQYAQEFIDELEAIAATQPAGPSNPKADLNKVLPLAFIGVGTTLGVGALLVRDQIEELRGQEVGAALFRQRLLFALGSDLSFAAAGVSFWVLQKRPQKVALMPIQSGALFTLSTTLGGP